MSKSVAEVLGKLFVCVAPQVKEFYRDRESRKRTFRMVDHPRVGKTFRIAYSPLYTLEADQDTGKAKESHMTKVQLLWEDGFKSHCPVSALEGFATAVDESVAQKPEPRRQRRNQGTSE